MRISLAFDLFRGGADGHAGWLWPLLAPVLAGHEVTVVAAPDPPARPEDWPLIYADPGRLGTVRAASGALLGAGLVIGHELSPNQLRVLAEAGVTVLDLALDAVRFAPDLLLRARTCDPALAADLAREAVPPWVLEGEAAALPAALRQPVGLGFPAALFVGQTDADASLIEGARLPSPARFVGAVRALVPAGGRLVLKPHPYARTHGVIRALSEQIPESLVVDDNIYRLLATPSVERVVTLSSSVAAEARYFSKPATCLIRPDRDGAAPPMEEARVTLAGLLRVLSRHLGGREAVSPRTLRQAVGQDWGYQAGGAARCRGVHAGQALDFSRAGAGSGLCTLGWSPPDADGIWTDGPDARLLVAPLRAGLTLALEVKPYLPRFGHAVQLEVHGGGHLLARAVLRLPVLHRVAVRLPPASGLVELRLVIGGASSPAEGGRSDDRRLLGVKLVRASVWAPVSGAMSGARAATHAALRTGLLLKQLILLLWQMA